MAEFAPFRASPARTNRQAIPGPGQEDPAISAAKSWTDLAPAITEGQLLMWVMTGSASLMFEALNLGLWSRRKESALRRARWNRFGTAGR